MTDTTRKTAFYKSNLGSFGSDIQADINGYVPTADSPCGVWPATNQ